MVQSIGEIQAGMRAWFTKGIGEDRLLGWEQAARGVTDKLVSVAGRDFYAVRDGDSDWKMLTEVKGKRTEIEGMTHHDLETGGFLSCFKFLTSRWTPWIRASETSVLDVDRGAGYGTPTLIYSLFNPSNGKKLEESGQTQSKPPESFGLNFAKGGTVNEVRRIRVFATPWWGTGIVSLVALYMIKSCTNTTTAAITGLSATAYSLYSGRRVSAPTDSGKKAE